MKFKHVVFWNIHFIWTCNQLTGEHILRNFDKGQYIFNSTLKPLLPFIICSI